MQTDENIVSRCPHILYMLVFNEDAATSSAFVPSSATDTTSDKLLYSVFKVMFWMNHDSKQARALLSLLFQVAGEQLFADVAKDILLYVSRDLSDKVNHLQPFEDFHANVRVRVF